jgi:hypothetical protein
VVACPAYGEFHRHDGNAEKYEAREVNKNKEQTTVLTRNVGKPPDIPEADGAASRNKNKAQS